MTSTTCGGRCAQQSSGDWPPPTSSTRSPFGSYTTPARFPFHSSVSCTVPSAGSKLTFTGPGGNTLRGSSHVQSLLLAPQGIRVMTTPPCIINGCSQHRRDVCVCVCVCVCDHAASRGPWNIAGHSCWVQLYVSLSQPHQEHGSNAARNTASAQMVDENSAPPVTLSLRKAHSLNDNQDNDN